MSVRDELSAEFRALAGWGLAIVGILVGGVGAITKFQWDAIHEIEAKQNLQIERLQSAQSDITVRLAETAIVLRNLSVVVDQMDARGTRAWNEMMRQSAPRREDLQ